MTRQEQNRLKIALGVLSGRLDPLEYIDDPLAPGPIRVDELLTGIEEDELFVEHVPHYEHLCEARASEHRRQMRELAELEVFNILVSLTEAQEVEF